MDSIFRLPGAAIRSPAIEAWLDGREPELGAIARQWFQRMRQCGDDVHELMQDGCPVACVGDAAFACVNVFKAHVNVGFFYGAELDNTAGMLEGAGRRMRHVTIRPGPSIDPEALARLIDLAYADVRWRIGNSG